MVLLPVPPFAGQAAGAGGSGWLDGAGQRVATLAAEA